AFEIPGFVPAYIRPLFCSGKGPFRWGALSGEPADIAVTDNAVLAVVPGDPDLHKWIALARERVAFQGLPARICWLGYGDRAKVGLAFNELVRTGRVKAPLVIGRDHLDCGSVASPYRETEDMKDGSDAIADWPLLNALVNTAAGASWVSLHHGGGVGHGGAGGESDSSVVCATGTVGIPGRTSGAGPSRILARGQPLGSGERHGGSRGAKSWVPVQTQAERECEEADRTNLPERGMGGGGATMAGERGRVAVERMEQGAAGCGAAAAIAEQTGRGSRNSG